MTVAQEDPMGILEALIGPLVHLALILVGTDLVGLIVPAGAKAMASALGVMGGTSLASVI